MLLSILAAAALPDPSAARTPAAQSVECRVAVRDSGRGYQVRCPVMPMAATDAGRSRRAPGTPADPPRAP